MKCIKSGKNPKHKSSDCIDVAAIPPVVQNIINGVKICGRRASGMAFAAAVRPTATDASGTYSCPSGYKPCQESWLADANAVEAALCIPADKDTNESCPITAFAFSLANISPEEAALYQRAATLDPSSTTNFFFSKVVKQLPIDELKISASVPCWNQKTQSRSPNQAFYFAELEANAPECTMPNEQNYRQMQLD